jgi:hypothetical protein
MSAKEKLRLKIENGPKNVRFKDLIKLMKFYRFLVPKTKDGVLFKHDKLLRRIPVPIPHGRENKVHKAYVMECLRAIEELEVIEIKGR